MSGKKQFFISIIIPTYNRPDKLSGCLQALAGQNYPANLFEVILVDDGGDFDLSQTLIPYESKLSISLIKQKNQGPAAARNSGITKADGEILVFTDDDCRPDSEWLALLNKKLQTDSPAMVGGATINNLTENLYSVTSQHIVDIVYHHYNADPQNARFFASNNIAIPKEILTRFGGFDGAFRTSEDRELCDRLIYKGCRLNYEPKAIVYHTHDLSFRQFCKQHFGYGRGAYRFHTLRAKRGSGKMVNELSFYKNLWSWLIAPLKEKDAWSGIKIIILMLIWQLVNIAGFFFETLYSLRKPNAD